MAMADPSRHDLALISYREVLDATKHQDDKIGRLLAAVAFLTGGALVFTTRDILQATYALGDHEYRLTALLLGAFLVLDLVAVALWILTMATPLTWPDTSDKHQSFLFFRAIADMKEDEWKEKWASDNLTEQHTDNLIVEAHNLARRADGKYDRSRLATRIFLASLILLVPALVLSIDSVSRTGPAAGNAALEERAGAAGPTTIGPQPGEAIVPAPWTTARRTLVAMPIAVVVLAIGPWRRWVSVPKTTGRGGDHPKKRCSLDLWALAFLQSLFVLAVIVGNGDMSAWAVLIFALGAAATYILFKLAWNTVIECRLGVWLTVASAALLTLLCTLATVVKRPDFQLLLAIVAACLVPLESFESPNELSDVVSSARSGQ